MPTTVQKTHSLQVGGGNNTWAAPFGKRLAFESRKSDDGRYMIAVGIKENERPEKRERLGTVTRSI